MMDSDRELAIEYIEREKMTKPAFTKLIYCDKSVTSRSSENSAMTSWLNGFGNVKKADELFIRKRIKEVCPLSDDAPPAHGPDNLLAEAAPIDNKLIERLYQLNLKCHFNVYVYIYLPHAPISLEVPTHQDFAACIMYIGKGDQVAQRQEHNNCDDPLNLMKNKFTNKFKQAFYKCVVPFADLEDEESKVIEYRLLKYSTVTLQKHFLQTTTYHNCTEVWGKELFDQQESWEGKGRYPREQFLLCYHGGELVQHTCRTHSS